MKSTDPWLHPTGTLNGGVLLYEVGSVTITFGNGADLVFVLVLAVGGVVVGVLCMGCDMCFVCA